MFEIAAALCALLLVLTGIVHSLLGERRLIGPLLARNDGILAVPLARFLIRYVWHLTSLVWVVLAAILLSIAFSPGNTARVALFATGIVFTLAGLIDAVGTRGRHVGWPFLTMIGLTALVAMTQLPA